MQLINTLRKTNLYEKHREETLLSVERDLTFEIPEKL